MEKRCWTLSGKLYASVHRFSSKFNEPLFKDRISIGQCSRRNGVEIVRINKMEMERKRAKATEKQALLQVPIAVDKPIARSEPVPVAVTEMETNNNPDVPLVEIVPEPPVPEPESMAVPIDAPDPVVEPVPMEIESDDEPEVTFYTRALRARAEMTARLVTIARHKMGETPKPKRIGRKATAPITGTKNPPQSKQTVQGRNSSSETDS